MRDILCTSEVSDCKSVLRRKYLFDYEIERRRIVGEVDIATSVDQIGSEHLRWAGVGRGKIIEDSGEIVGHSKTFHTTQVVTSIA